MRRTIAALIIVAGCAASARVHGADDNDLEALRQRIERLDAMTGRAEAISAIKRLQHAYGHYSELGLWHDFADLFADPGIGYYTQGALDRDGIRSLFLKEVGQGRLGLADGRIYPHISMQPVVTLAPDGQSGKARWHIMAMLGGYQGNASWSGGVYENAYVRERGVWKFQEVRYYPQYSGRYEAPGWSPTKAATPFHFDAAAVGATSIPAAAAQRPASSPPTLASLAARLTELAARAQRLGDEIEITNLQHAYGYYADRKMWDDVADLFAPDATMEIGLRGVYAGRASIRRGLNALGPAGLAEGELNDRIHLQTIVTVAPDGRTARVRGTELAMTGSAGGKALWRESIYENELVKQRGVWTFRAMHLYPRFIVDAEKGWGNDAQPAPGPSRQLPPDRGPTESYEIFPRFHIALLHFAHPVTGRAPRYPDGTAVRPTAFGTAPAAAPSGAPAAVKTVQTAAAMLTAAERSVARAVAYHAAENLVTAYGFYLDEHKWDDIADLFARDGWMELPYVGTYAGRDRIREALKRRDPSPRDPNVLQLHQIVQPVIHVSADGRTARIRARAFQLGTGADGAGSWLGAVYENTAINEDGTWKLSGLDVDYVWQSPSRGGWVHVTAPPAAPELGLTREYPPDRPLRGSVAPPFPKVSPMPFHYKNPVSGRVPPILLP
jgi:hypothetical protein